MKLKRKLETKHVLIALGVIALLSYTGIGNKLLSGEPANQALMDGEYSYDACSGGECETRFIGCTTDEDCQSACLGDTTYAWIADQLSELNVTQAVTESTFYEDIMASHCTAADHCIVSEYCVYSGAFTDYVKEHPWAWVQKNPVVAVGIALGIIALFVFV